MKTKKEIIEEIVYCDEMLKGCTTLRSHRDWENRKEALVWVIEPTQAVE